MADGYAWMSHYYQGTDSYCWFPEQLLVSITDRNLCCISAINSPHSDWQSCRLSSDIRQVVLTLLSKFSSYILPVWVHLPSTLICPSLHLTQHSQNCLRTCLVLSLAHGENWEGLIWSERGLTTRSPLCYFPIYRSIMSIVSGSHHDPTHDHSCKEASRYLHHLWNHHGEFFYSMHATTVMRYPHGGIGVFSKYFVQLDKLKICLFSLQTGYHHILIP